MPDLVSRPGVRLPQVATRRWIAYLPDGAMSFVEHPDERYALIKSHVYEWADTHSPTEQIYRCERRVGRSEWEPVNISGLDVLREASPPDVPSDWSPEGLIEWLDR